MKSVLDFLIARVTWQSFANCHARPYPTSVSPDQREPSGKVNYRFSVDAVLCNQNKR